jgi:hypothetical protein
MPKQVKKKRYIDDKEATKRDGGHYDHQNSMTWTEINIVPPPTTWPKDLRAHKQHLPKEVDIDTPLLPKPTGWVQGFPSHSGSRRWVTSNPSMEEW